MKTILVTGATRNTGLAVAEKFASEGYNVAITSRSKESSEKAAAYIAEKYGVQAKGYALDLANVAEIEAVFADVEASFGGLDVFVGNAANLGVDCGLLNSDEKTYYDITDINFKGNFFCCQCAAKIMKKQREGAIVIIGSVHNHATIQGRALYSATKGALLSLTHAMAVELGAYSIRVNYLAAGAIHTERWDVLDEATVEKRRANYPLGTESMPEDIANGVYYLGSDASRTVTGIELTVDSGVSSCILGFTKPKDFKETEDK